jgi:hypothetical protein
MDLTLAVTCEEARERPDGRMDVVGVFNELGAPGFPALQDRMTLVLVMEWAAGEAGRQALRADLLDEADQRILTIEGHTDVTARREEGARAQTRLILLLERVVFPHAGRYHFDLIAAGDVRRACSLLVGQLEHG